MSEDSEEGNGSEGAIVAGLASTDESSDEEEDEADEAVVIVVRPLDEVMDRLRCRLCPLVLLFLLPMLLRAGDSVVVSVVAGVAVMAVVAAGSVCACECGRLTVLSSLTDCVSLV